MDATKLILNYCVKSLIRVLISLSCVSVIVSCKANDSVEQSPLPNHSRWELLDFSDSLGGTNQVTFLSKQTGFIIGGYRKAPFTPVLLRTTNGATWQTISLQPPTLGGFAVLDAVSPNLVWAAGRNAQANTTILYKSQDVGTSWQAVVGNFPAEGTHALKVLTAEQGVAQGVDGLFLTTDGGKQWQITFQEVANYRNFDHLFFLDNQIGFAAGGIFSDDSKLGSPVFNQGAVIKTTDGGRTWQKLSSAFGRITALFFLDSHNGFITTQNQDLWTTIDGGSTWQIRATKLPSTGVDMAFLSPKNGILVTSDSKTSAIYNTSDGGVSWQSEYSTQQFNLTNLSVIDAQTMYVNGTDGKLLKRINP